MNVTLTFMQAKLNDELNNGDGGHQAQEIMTFLEPYIETYSAQRMRTKVDELTVEAMTDVSYHKAAARAFQTDLAIMNAKYLKLDGELKAALSQAEAASRIMKLVSVEFTDEVATLRESVPRSEFRPSDYEWFCHIAEEDITDQ